MKALFTAIRRAELERVRALVAKDPAIVHAVAKPPPAKDDGQSPLQVAFKTGGFAIADFLIDQGADVCFMETESSNEWRTPVLHDAIRAAVFSARIPNGIGGTINSHERFEWALASLTKLLAAGADVRAIDSYGNSAAVRFGLDLRQALGGRDAAPLREDLWRVHDALAAAGVDLTIPNDPKARELPSWRALASFVAKR